MSVLTEIKQAIICPQLAEVASQSLKRAIDYVLDGDTFEDLEGCVKTFIGTKFEKNFVRAMDFPYGPSLLLDTKIAGHDVDIKLTIGTNWMIPPECVEQHCLLCKVDYPAQVFSLGLFHSTASNLTQGSNRDQKRSVSASGKKAIEWILVDQPITQPLPQGC